MSNKLRYASPVKPLSKINLLCKQKKSRIMNFEQALDEHIQSICPNFNFTMVYD